MFDTKACGCFVLVKYTILYLARKMRTRLRIVEWLCHSNSQPKGAELCVTQYGSAVLGVKHCMFSAKGG